MLSIEAQLAELRGTKKGSVLWVEVGRFECLNPELVSGLPTFPKAFGMLYKSPSEQDDLRKGFVDHPADVFGALLALEPIFPSLCG